MQSVYLEWFLLDNALMAYLILRTAAAMARLPTRTWLLFVVSVFSALAGAAAMVDARFLSIPAKLALFGVMTLPFRWKTGKQWFRAAACVLASTFLFGGAAYALAFFFESDFQGGVLYASDTVRAVLLAAVFALWVPKYIRRTLETQRLTRTHIFLRVSTRFGDQDMHARLDSGHSLLAEDAPVVIVDAHSAAAALPRAWIEGSWQECGVPGMGLLPFQTASGRGVMPTLPATVSWRWEDETEQERELQSKRTAAAGDTILRAAGAFFEDSRTPKQKRARRRMKRAQRKAEAWLETRACRIAIATEHLQGCDALVGLDFIELH